MILKLVIITTALFNGKYFLGYLAINTGSGNGLILKYFKAKIPVKTINTHKLANTAAER